MSQTVANSALFWLVLIGALAVLYLLPVLIGLIRRAEDMWLIVLFTVLPTGVGWLAALFLACLNPRREPPAVYYHPGYYDNPYHRY